MSHLIPTPRNAVLARRMGKDDPDALKGIGSKRSLASWTVSACKPQIEKESSLAIKIHEWYALPWSREAELECAEHWRLQRQKEYDQLARHQFSARRLIDLIHRLPPDSHPSEMEWGDVIVAYSFLTRWFSAPGKRRDVTAGEEKDYVTICTHLRRFLKPLTTDALWAQFLYLKVSTNIWAVHWNRTPSAKRPALREEFEKIGLFRPDKLRVQLEPCPRDFDLVYNALAYASVMNMTDRFEQLDILLTEANGGRRVHYENRAEFDEDFKNLRSWLANRLLSKAA